MLGEVDGGGRIGGQRLVEHVSHHANHLVLIASGAGALRAHDVLAEKLAPELNDGGLFLAHARQRLAKPDNVGDGRLQVFGSPRRRLLDDDRERLAVEPIADARGQRQRISLARAFLKNAPILILDEPTSALDINAETAVLDAIQRLMKGRTTLMIAHRASALRNCNIILILEDGRVSEMTTEVGSVLSGMTAVSIQR